MNFPKAERLKPYAPGAGAWAIRLDANESPFDLPGALRERVAAAVAAQTFNRYPDPLAAGVCEAWAKLYGVDPALVTAGNGSDELISILLNTFVSRGGRVVITEPDFSMYRFYSELAELTPVVVPKDGNLCVSAQALIEAARRERPAMLLFSNPCNPTGQGLTRAEILRVVGEAGCLVVVDEAYMDFWDESVLADVPAHENLLVLRTGSKSGLAALRIGFAIANPKITALLRAAKSPYNVNSLTQAAARAVFSEPGYLAGAVAQIRALRDELHAALSALAGRAPGRLRVLPARANFVPVLAPDAEALHRELLARGISVRLFAADRLLRITAGTKEENAALLAALEAALGL